MLNWVSPGLLWLATLAGPVIFFYFLRMRFREQPVSSVYLWNRLAASLQYGSRLQLRSVLLLILQVMAVLSLALAIANPYWQQKRLIKPGTVFLIDISGSMNAKDVAASGGKISRIKAACEFTRQELQKLPDGVSVMIFLCGARIEALGEATSDRRFWINRLNTVAVSAEGFREESVAAELKTWMNSQDRPWQGYLVTDGGADLSGTQLAALFNGAFRAKTIGRNSHDIGLTGLRLVGNKAQFWIYNGWPVARSVKVSLWKDQKRLTEATLTAEPGATIHRTALPGGVKTGIFQVRLDGNNDILTLDDQYYLAVNPARRFKILSVGPGNAFLRALLNTPLIDYTETRSFPAGFTGKSWDLVIADRVTAPQSVETNVLSFGNGRIDRHGDRVNGPLVPADTGHPLLRYFEPEGVQVNQSLILPVDGTAQVLATVGGQPVITVRNRRQWKEVDCGFNLLNSNLGLSGAFPILLQNYLQWIVPQGGNRLADTLTAGETVYRSEPPEWQLNEQSGIGWERPNAFVKLFPFRPGVYHWRNSHQTGLLAVNPPASELDVEPRPIRPVKQPAYLGAELKEERTSLTGWFLAVFLMAVIAEWMIWRGGSGAGIKALLSFQRSEGR